MKGLLLAACLGAALAPATGASAQTAGLKARMGGAIAAVGGEADIQARVEAPEGATSPAAQPPHRPQRKVRVILGSPYDPN